MPNTVELRAQLPDSAAALRRSTGEAEQSFYAFHHGDGITLSFVLLMQPDCVATLLLNAEVEDG